MDDNDQEIQWYRGWMVGKESLKTRQAYLQLEDNWNKFEFTALSFFHKSIQLVGHELLCKLFKSEERNSRPSPLNPSLPGGTFEKRIPAELEIALHPPCAIQNVMYLSGNIIQAITWDYPLEREYQYRCLLASLICLRACGVEKLDNDTWKNLQANIISRQADLQRISLLTDDQSTSGSISSRFNAAQADALVYAISELSKQMPNSQKLCYTLVERSTNLLSVILTVTSAATGSSAVNVEYAAEKLINTFKPINPKPSKSAESVFTVFHATLVTNALHLLATVLQDCQHRKAQARLYFRGAAALASLVLSSITQQIREYGEFWSSNSGQFQPHHKARASSLNIVHRTGSFKGFYKVWLLLDCANSMKECLHGHHEDLLELDEIAMRIATEGVEQILRLKALQYLFSSINCENRTSQFEKLLLRARLISTDREACFKEETRIINFCLPDEDQFDADSLFEAVRRPSGIVDNVLVLPLTWTERSHFPSPARHCTKVSGISSMVFKKDYSHCDIAISDELDNDGRRLSWAIFSSGKVLHVYRMENETIESQKPVFELPGSRIEKPKGGLMIQKIATSSTCLAVIADSTIWGVDFSAGWSHPSICMHRLAEGLTVTAVAVYSEDRAQFIAVGFSFQADRGLIVELQKMDPESGRLTQHSVVQVLTKNSRPSITRLEFSTDGKKLLATTDDNTVYVYPLQSKRAKTLPFQISRKYGQPGVPYSGRKGISSSALFKSPSEKQYVLLGTAPAKDRALNQESMYEFPFISPVSDGPAKCPSRLEHPLRLKMGDIWSVAVSPNGTVAALADNEDRVIITELDRAPFGGVCAKYGDEGHLRVKFSDKRIGTRSPQKPKSVCVRWLEENEKLSLLALDNQGRTIKVTYQPMKGKERANSAQWSSSQ